MPSWKTKALARVHELARVGRVLMTRKAILELSDLGLDLRPTGVPDVLLELRAADVQTRVRSNHDDSWLFIFSPTVEGLRIYLKLAIHDDCVVISFHGYE